MIKVTSNLRKIFDIIFAELKKLEDWSGNIGGGSSNCQIPFHLLVTFEVSGSVTRFGERLQVLGKFLMVYLLFGKMLSLLLQICDIIGLIFSVANGQILKNNLTIWSHWTLSTTRSRTSTNYFLIVRTTQSFHSKCFNGIGIDDDMSRPWQVAFKFSWYWHFITYYYLPTYVDELLASVFLVLEAS